MRPDGQLPCQPRSLLGDRCAAPLGALGDKAGRVIVPWLVHDGPLVRSGWTLEAGELLTIAARLSLGLDGVPILYGYARPHRPFGCPAEGMCFRSCTGSLAPAGRTRRTGAGGPIISPALTRQSA